MEIFLAMTYAGLRSLPFLFLIYYPFRHELRLPDWCVVAFTVVLALIDGMQCAGFVSINNLEPLLYAGQLSFAVLVIRTAFCKKLFFICLSIFMERFFYLSCKCFFRGPAPLSVLRLLPVSARHLPCF